MNFFLYYNVFTVALPGEDTLPPGADVCASGGMGSGSDCCLTYIILKNTFRSSLQPARTTFPAADQVIETKHNN